MADTGSKSGEFGDGKLWYQRKGKMIVLGLTSTAVDEMGTVEGIEFPDAGVNFSQGDVVLTVDGTHGMMEVVTPASGNIIEINHALRDELDIITEDPTEEGWLVKIEIDDASEIQDYIEAEAS